MIARSDLTEITDEGLLDIIIQSRCHVAFSELVSRHAAKFRQLAFRFVGTRQDAEDIVQEAFIKLWNKPGMWKSGHKARFRTWFYRVIINQCLDHNRRNKKVTALIDKDYTDSGDLQDKVLEEKQMQVRVERAFASLPKPMQISLNLSFYEAVPNKDAAEIMGLSLKAFQSLLMRAKGTLRDRIMGGDCKKVGTYENK